MTLFHRNTPELPKLNTEDAAAIMDNVFAACEKPPCTIPLEVLTSYTQYRSERYTVQKVAAAMMLCVFLLLPAFFVTPDFGIQQIDITPTGIPTLEVAVSNKIPVRLVSAKLDGRSIPVYESEAGVFTMEPNDNGELSVTVTLANRQYFTQTVTVEGVDATVPELVSSKLVDGRLRIYLTDAGVGVDFEHAYGISGSGSRIEPVVRNAEEGYLEFTFDQNLNIFVPDFNENTLQMILTKS